ncbi:FtsX-like permease family protein [Microbacterium abyssi]|uniref:FtsX-like permease family protein n=1 Tax=Microbacterium abyssi TaxID=2782166 RepID=UPI001886E56D|nr:FtsX-like permease family protein [Microbacterium sp. A18JL241]
MTGRIPLLMRGASTTPALSLFLVVVIAVLSYLGAAAPAVLADGRTATVQRAVDSLPDLARWPSATTPGLPAFAASSEPGIGVWGRTMTVLEAKREEQPEPLRSLLGEPRVTMTVDPLPTTDEGSDSVVPRNKVGLVSDPGLADRADLVEGRLPELTDPARGIEIVLTQATAEQLDWKTGTVRRWEDTTLMLSGIVAPSGRDDGDWAFISGSVEPLVEVDADGNRTLVVAGFMHVDEAAALTDRVREIKTVAWMPFDTDAVDGASAATLAAQLRLLTASPAEIPMHDMTFYNRGLAFSSSLPQAIDTGTLRADAMTDVVAVAAGGPVAAALVVLALVSRLIAVRRTASTRVLRARGASTARLVALLGGEGATLGLLGALLGAGTAAAVPGWAAVWVLLVPAVLAFVPAVVLPSGALTDAERRGRSDLGDRSRAGAGRAALELLILVVTGVFVALVVTRSGAGGADPLLLALPVLLGASGGILALRLLPVLLRVAEDRGRRRPSLTALLGPARARREPVVRIAPVLAAVVGLGVAVFSVAFVATVSAGVDRSATISVGADVRVDAGYIDGAGAQRVAALDGVAATASLSGDSTVDASVGAQTVRAHVYTVGRDEMVSVQQGSATALPLPAALTEEAAGNGVPVVVSDGLLARLGAADQDDLDLEIAGRPVRVVGTAPSQVPFGTAEQWVIVDPANAAALGERGTGASQLYLALTPDADPDAVGADAVAALGGDAAFETPALVAAGHADDPVFGIVQGTLLAASVLVALLLAAAVVATLVLGAPSRARMLAILRTLGHPQRAAGRLVTWEVAPALLLALPFGVGAGVAMTWLVIPQLDLRGFVGGSGQPPIELGGAWSLLVVAGFALSAVGAIAAATALASRAGAAEMIRADDEAGQ